MTVVKRWLKHPVVQNTIVLYGVQFSGYLLPLISLSYLARVLGPGKLGLIALAQAFAWYFMTLTEYGFNLTATRKIAILRDDPEAVSRTFSTVLAAKGVLLALSFVAMIAIIAAVPRFRAEWPLFLVSFVGVIGDVIFPVWLFQGMQKMQYVGVRDITSKLIATACVFIFVRTGNDYVLAAGIQSCGLLAGGLITVFNIPRVMPWIRLVRPTWREIRASLEEGWAVFLSMATMAMYHSTSVMLLGLIASNEIVGYYSAAVRIIVAVRMLVSPVCTAIYPHISHIASTSNERAVRFLQTYSIRLALPFLLISLGLFAGAPLLVRVLYGPNFGQTASLLRIMSMAPVLLALSTCYSTFYLLAFGFEKEWSKIIVQACFINLAILGLLIFLIPPAVAVALTGLMLDGFVLVRSWMFYRRTAVGRNPTDPVVQASPLHLS